jgi:hypothetical protein
LHNNDEYSSSFGCHVAVRDVAPGFCVRKINGGGEMSLLWTSHVLLAALLSSHVVLCLSEVSWDECGMGCTYCGVLNYIMTTNDEFRSLFVVWLPHCGRRCGTWSLYQRDKKWGGLTLARRHLGLFMVAGSCSLAVVDCGGGC